jgi:segregation and condensation protein A
MSEQISAASDTLFENSRDRYNVKLDVFEGPLDLLLHLIRKNEMEISDIPIALITRQYLEYLKLMKELNLEVAGDFLVMASTLLQIKSRMLLPVYEPEDGEGEEEEDPRAELVRRLLEYQRYKDVGLDLDRRELLGREVFKRSFADPTLAALPVEEGPLELDLFALTDAFSSLLARIPAAQFHDVGADSLSIADAINEILSLLQENESIEFESIFANEFSRERLIVTFLALLELCRLKLVKILQNSRYGTIHIFPAVMQDQTDGDDDGTAIPTT